MNKIRFIILACILWIAGIVNAQQQVSENEAENAAINTLYNKAEILNTEIEPKLQIIKNNKKGVVNI
jgi:hypothetical protein